jgi:hypothetical protein
LALFNLLGSVANFGIDTDGNGAADGWNVSGAYNVANGWTASLVQLDQRNNYQRITTGTADTTTKKFLGTSQTFTLKAGKCYLYLVESVTDGSSTASLGIVNTVGPADLIFPTPTSASKTLYAKYSPPSDLTVTVRVCCNNNPGVVGWVQFVRPRFYEIDASSYAKVDVDPAYTGENLAALYPYVYTVMEGPEKESALVNLLGNTGDFELTVSPWVPTASTISLDSASAYTGKNGLLVTSTATTSYYADRRYSGVEDGKYYLILAYFKNNLGSSGTCQTTWRFNNTNVGGTINLVKSGKPIAVGSVGTAYVVVKPTDFVAAHSQSGTFCHVRVSSSTGAVGQKFSVDAIRMYEISAEIANKIDIDPYYTDDYLVDKYPYRDRALSGYGKPAINWTSQNNFNAPDMNRIEQNAQSLAAYLQTLQYAIPPLTNVTNRTTATVETFDSFNRFESNIDTIRANFMTPTGYIAPKTWGVGVGFDYNDPNRWQTNLQALFDQAVSVEKSFQYCGTTIAGAFAIRAGSTPEEGQATPPLIIDFQYMFMSPYHILIN